MSFLVHERGQYEPPACGATGPARTLWGRRTNLICSLRQGHLGDHCDQLITGYSQGNWWPR